MRNELEILLRLDDQATPQLAAAAGTVKREVAGMGEATSQATNRIKGFNDELKGASKNLRDMRQTAFVATAAIALVIQSVATAAKYNKEANETFERFKIATTSLAATLGQILAPALELITNLIGFLNDVLESAVAGFIKVFSFTAEFFSNILSGPVEAYRRAVEVANFATDSFLNKIEETRSNVAQGITLEPITIKIKNLGDAAAEAARKTKEQWDVAKKTMVDFGNALAQAEVLGKGFAKAAAAVAIGMAIVNTAEGVTNVWAKWAWNPPVAQALSAIVMATGALQIATIAATKFATGTDTVPAMLTPGEMVIPRSFSQAIRDGDLTLGGRGSTIGDINISIFADMSSDMGVERTAEMLGFEIERRLRGARSIA